MPDWPHAPLHRLSENGTYMVTAGTLAKQHFFRPNERVHILHDMLQELAAEYAWQLEAWAIFSNHYHFVGQSPEDPTSLKRMLSKLHTLTSRELNCLDGAPGRQIWFQYWDHRITFQKSYLARLQYVHTNPVHHGLVKVATEYPWCSAAWFERTATSAFYRMLNSLKVDRLNVIDDF